MKKPEKAICVEDNNGYFRIPFQSKEENWNDVKRDGENIEWIFHLNGWGEYNECYRITVNGFRRTYFVAHHC